MLLRSFHDQFRLASLSRIICGITTAFLISSCDAPPALQKAQIDEYKQMGSIAALAELCLESTALPDTLQQKLEEAADKNPEAVDTLNSAIEVYTEAYEYGLDNRRIWNGTKQQYNEATFDCAKAEDVSQIQTFESQVLAALKAQR